MKSKRLKIFIQSKPAELVISCAPTKEIGVWTGKNFKWFLRELASINTELGIRIQGDRLVIHDESRYFYRTFLPGQVVEILLYEAPVIYEDEFPPPHVDDAETLDRLIRWGLVKK